MHRIILILLFFPFIIYSQLADYELEFTSFSQDYLEMQNTSSALTNSNAFSVSAWVNPQSNTNHGGIVGFRNNIDADFYLLQLQNTNNVEARFRNSTGINYDIIANGILDFNQWQHLTFTYDGSYIRLYKNGIIVDSTVASGNIMQSAESLRVGSLNYQGLEFYFIGRIDEVRLWNVCLSSTEISNWMCAEIDQAHPDFINLMGYWRINEGQGIIAYDQTSNANDGTLINAVATYQNATSCFASSGSLPKTYVPDDNFEAYLEANGMGDGIALNDSVFTSAIDTVLALYLSNLNISDLIGIEDFTSLTSLHCENNQLSSLDLSNNLNLQYLSAHTQNISTLILPNSNNLLELSFGFNYITSIDLSTYTNLTVLDCAYNGITDLDLSNNSSLISLVAQSGFLHNLDLRNGNNYNMINMLCFDNDNLTCINVDDVAWSAANWTVANGNIDTQHYFSNNCITPPIPTWDCIGSSCIDQGAGTGIYTDSMQCVYNCLATDIINIDVINQVKLIKIIDVLGIEKKRKKNQPLFYIYDDGTVEKKMILE